MITLSGALLSMQTMLFNAVGGYEFKIGKRKLGAMSFGLRATWAGGNPYVPFDIDQTVAAHQTVMDWEHSYNPVILIIRGYPSGSE